MLDVVEITCRHHTELAVAWWRRENSPILLLRGQLRHFHELDEKMIAYMDGAALNTSAVFDRLSKHQNTIAFDFVGDMVAALLITSVGGVNKHTHAWIKTVEQHAQFMSAFDSAKCWLGKTGVEPHDKLEPDASIWHASNHLRFINGLGEIRGNYALPVPSSAVNGSLAPAISAISELCTNVLQTHQAGATYWHAKASRWAISDQYMLAGISGDPAMFASIGKALGTDIEPRNVVAALDALRRITAFDALETIDAERQLPSTLTADSLKSAQDNARQWLAKNAGHYDKETRYFLGYPLGQKSSLKCLAEILQFGYQTDREIAAMHIHRLSGKTLPVRTQVALQVQYLNKHFPIGD